MNRTFYGLDKAGGYKQWQIEVKDGLNGDAYLVVTHGKEGGKLQEKVDYISVGKQGRSAFEQAISEANGKIKKQMDSKGYRESKEELTSLPLLPMLAEDYRKKGSAINFPCYAPVKLDGLRSLCLEEAELRSRGGQPFTLPHIQDVMRQIMKGVPLDGELYYHGAELEDIMSATKRVDTQAEVDECKRKLDKAKTEGAIAKAQFEYDKALYIQWLRPRLTYQLFDMVTDDTYEVRRAKLIEFHGSLPEDVKLWIGLVVDCIVHNESEMKAAHKVAVAQGYEGVMLRNKDGLYESGKRSSDLQKYKEFFDDEFEIVDIVEDKNGNAMCVLYDPLAKATFPCGYGDFTQRKEQLNNPQNFIGKFMTVQFQKRFKKTLLPQFGTGKMIREGVVVNGIFVPSY